MTRTRVWTTLAIVIGLTFPASAADWPEWRGAGRGGVWEESGILEKFPDDGLEVRWRAPVAEGYSGPAVADGRVFVTDFVREKAVRGVERLLCLDEATGELLWKVAWDVDYSGTEPRWASGPRATPTVHRDTVFVMGGMATLVAVDVASGEVRWRKDLVAGYGASIPTWGVSSAPVVEGELLIALVGGERGAGVVAFDQRTGEERWRALSIGGDPGYAPPLVVDAGGVRQLLIWHPRAFSGLDPLTGRLLWTVPAEVNMGMTVATPVVDSDRILVTSFFNGSMMLRLGSEPPSATVSWARKGQSEQPADTRALHSLISTPVFDGDTIYGIDSYGELRALDANSGERLWESNELVGETARWAAGFLVRTGDRYFVNTDRGDLVIVQLTRTGYREIDRTPLIEPTSTGGGRRELGAVHWSHPAYANRHVVVRNDREILRASLEAPTPAPSPYVGRERREIKSLSADDVADLIAGKGWGLALPAELNGAPGPAHVLELERQLGLSADQVARVRAVYRTMHENAVRLGRRFVEQERALDRAFVEGSVTPDTLRELVSEVARTRGELRFAHLVAHLETLPILTAEQVRSYSKLRGYDGEDPCAAVPDGHDPVMWRRHNGCNK